MNKILPPLDVDKENKPIDKQKEAEANAPHGSLVLGINLLTKLGTGEEAVLKQIEDVKWLLKQNEELKFILEDKMFNQEVIYA